MEEMDAGGSARCSWGGHGLGPLDLNKTLVIHTRSRRK